MNLPLIIIYRIFINLSLQPQMLLKKTNMNKIDILHAEQNISRVVDIAKKLKIFRLNFLESILHVVCWFLGAVAERGSYYLIKDLKKYNMVMSIAFCVVL
jgi:hypothetical protein